MTKIKIRGKPHFCPYIFTLFPLWCLTFFFSPLLVPILENASRFCPYRYIRDEIHIVSKRQKLRTLKYCPFKPRGFLALQLVMWHSNPKATKTKTNKKHRRPNKLTKKHKTNNFILTSLKSP